MSKDGPPPDTEHQPPAGVTTATVDAIGTLTKGLEIIEWARGHLYAFHQLSGEGNRQVEEAIPMLRDAGHEEWADRLEKELFGRNVLDGRWTFQIVEEYDDGYWSLYRQLERELREDLVKGRRHLREAGMKEDQRTEGEPGHESRPPKTS
jgi:hypothetical protein